MPHPDDIELLETDPMAVRSQAYDLVLNGWELGSGSIRIHETELQRRVFDALGITEEEADRKFGFFLNPFEYGAPPHGGFAFGLDRLVADPRRRGEHPRGHRLPEDPVRRRPDDPLAAAGRPGPARPARHPRRCRRPDVDPAAWNARYSGGELVWSAEPNRFLPPEVADLAPGRALDVACGEGRNGIWLARQGWDVVGVDFAEAGIATARRLASEAGVTVDWVVGDVTTFTPDGLFDLVIVFYLQLEPAPAAAALGRAGAALAPGGTLLVVGHHVDNLERGYGGPSTAAVLHDPAVIASQLAAAGLTVSRADLVERPVDTPDGVRVALDSLVRAQRGRICELTRRFPVVDDSHLPVGRPICERWRRISAATAHTSLLPRAG